MKNKKFALVFLILFLSFATLLLVKKNFFTKQINEGFSEFNNENALQDVPLNNENLKFSAPLTPKNAYAIVVGISDYPGSTSDLTYCDDDAQAVYSLLINDFNFKPNNIIYLQDSSATKNAISNAFDQVASQISSDDIFFFYYSGHGGASTSNDGVHSYSIDSPHPYPNNYDNMWSIFYTDAAYMRVHFDHFDLEYDYDWVYLGDSDLADGWYYEGYSGYSTGFWSGWIPLLSDNRMYIRMITDSSIAEWGFSIDQFEVEIYDGTHFLCSYDSIPYNPNNFYLDSLLNSKLDNIHCDERYVILDACNTGGMIPEVQQVGRYIMTACSDEESSLESPLLEHGVFTNYFLESFDNAADSNGDGVRSMEECYSYIYSNTVSHSESMGYTHHPQEYDGISGEVMLSTSFGNISLIPIGNILSYSFDLYGLGLIEELKVAVCNNSAGVIYNTLDLTTIPASNTGFGEYSGTIQLNDVSGLSGYGIYAKINGYYIIVLNQTYSEDTDSDGLDDVFEIMTDLNPETNDTDADGLEDMLEYYGDTDPLLNDTDVDGLLDGDEILTYFTNATNPDTDNDGLSDGVEVLVYTTNPLLQDTEGDGMDDGYEVNNDLNPLVDDSSLDYDNDDLSNLDEFLIGTLANNSDTDGDLLMDGLEVLNYTTNPLNQDTDGDSVSDGSEVLIYLTNATNPDTEGDGMDDGFEITYNLNPLVDDSGMDNDYDGLINLLEYQCGASPLVADSDGDFMNDFYEYQNGLNLSIDDANEDKDNDGLSNLLEYLIGSLANDADSDNDQMPDYWEFMNNLNVTLNDANLDNDQDGLNNLYEYNIQTNPQGSDTDNDGLSDGDEVLIHFTDPTNPDTDGDGYMDGIEVLWGSNPLDAKITLNTVFFNIAGIVLLLSTGYYTVRTQLYKKKHDVKEKIPKAKFSIGKKSEIYNALTVTKQEKPKQVVPYKKSPYSVPYTQPTTKTTSLNINQLKNTILYHLPPPKTSNSTEGKRALTMANYAFKLFSQGRYQESILNMLKALMLGVPEPTNSRLKIIILDSLNRIEDSIRSLTSYTSPTIGETHLTKSCVFCGTLNKITNKFCTECGRAL